MGVRLGVLAPLEKEAPLSDRNAPITTATEDVINAVMALVFFVGLMLALLAA